MHFSTLAVPVMALFSTTYAAAAVPTITVYSDAACKHQIQTVSLTRQNTYQCKDFSSTTAQGVIFSKTGWNNRGFNVWDSQYCDGDAGGSPLVLGQCLSAASYGLAAWKSVHISPRNTLPQA